MNDLKLLSNVFQNIFKCFILRTQCIKIIENSFRIDDILFHCTIYYLFKYKIIIRIQINS
ncbi:hypothetical protein c7_R164 [Megavirus courdo7]|uniref:Uncharacterized protein n=1 Tax=Megavirus courdo7 TaxID=1128135 RepID=H2EA07_9VIRU|nr:hypothetical protein c7_R164 [Megavirus courdo7]